MFKHEGIYLLFVSCIEVCCLGIIERSLVQLGMRVIDLLDKLITKDSRILFCLPRLYKNALCFLCKLYTILLSGLCVYDHTIWSMCIRSYYLVCVYDPTIWSMCIRSYYLVYVYTILLSGLCIRSYYLVYVHTIILSGLFVYDYTIWSMIILSGLCVYDPTIWSMCI